MSFDFAAIYRSHRERFSALVLDLDAHALATVVPATPLWTVQDAFAHVAGVAFDISVGRLDGVTSELWTQRQVDERHGRTPGEIEREWSDLGPTVEAILEAAGPAMSHMVMDVVMHHCDVTGALGIPAPREDEGLRLCLRAANAISAKIDAAGLPALRVETEGLDRVLGNGDASITVRGDSYEIARALFGRRSIAQIAMFDWTGDPTPYLPLFSVFTPRQTPLVE